MFNGIERLSQNLREQVLKIMGQDAGEVDARGDKGNRISSQKEYDELCNLLSGAKGTERNVLEGLKIEYEEQAMVRDSVKKSVLYAIKDGDFDNKADFKTEIDALKEYLNRNKKQLNNAEIAFIKRVIAGEEVKMENMFPPNQVENKQKADPPKEKQPTEGHDPKEKEIKPEPGKPIKEDPWVPDPGKPIKEDPWVPDPGKPIKEDPWVPKPGKPIKNDPWVPKPEKPIENDPWVPDPAKPDETKYKVSEGDSQKANAYARSLLIEIVKLGAADNKLIANILNNVDRKTAYSFLKSFNESPRVDDFNKEVFRISDIFNKLTYDDVHHVMSALVEQARDCGLEKEARPLQERLQYWNQCNREGLLKNNDLNANQIKEADKLVKDLIRKMDKVIQ